MGIKFVWKGKSYPWDGIDLDEAEKIKNELTDDDGKPMLPLAFDAAVFSLDPSAIKMLVSILLTRDGTPTNFEDVKGKLADFNYEVDEEGKAPAEPTSSEPESSTSGSPTSRKRSRTTPTNSGASTD